MIAGLALGGTPVPAGPPGISAWAPVAAWAPSTTYIALPPASVVAFQGGCYVCTTAHVSSAVFDATKWLLIATGSPGPASWLPPVDWASGLTCVIGPPATTAVFGGALYLCIVPHISAATFDPTKWMLIASGAPGPAPWLSPVSWASGLVCVVGPPATAAFFDGSLYICTTAHVAGATFDPTKWQLWFGSVPSAAVAQPNGIASLDGDGHIPSEQLPMIDAASQIFGELPAENLAPGVAAQNLGFSTGTWNPVLQFGGASTGIAYTGHPGTYVRIGNLVIAQFYVFLSSLGTAKGNATISGLPFDENSGMEATFNPRDYYNMVDITSLAGSIPTGTSALSLYNNGATGAVPLTDANFTAATICGGTIIYMTP